MDYYGAMEEAMIDAAEDSLKPTDMSGSEMMRVILCIGISLKGSLPDSERIILTAQRQELRLRLLRAEQVAQRLLGVSNGK